MKRFLLTLAAAFVAFSSFAQNITAGVRYEAVEIEENDNEYSIFEYKDDDGTYGVYLSLGRSFPILEIISDDSLSSLSHFDETCLYVGKSYDDVIPFLDNLLALADQEQGSTAKFPCRLSSGSEKLMDSATATCMVVNRFLQTKRLSFIFSSGGHTAEADLTKSAIKSLRTSFAIYKKLHP